MRPKKKVLLVDSDEERRGCIAFMLETNGYAVTRAENCRQADRLAETSIFDVMVVQFPIEGGAQLLSKRRDPYFGVPSLALTDSFARDVLCGANALIGRRESTAVVLERIKILCARKRGPRKQQPESIVERRSA